MQFVGAFAFLLGVATFVLVNAVLFLMAYPTMPNPGPQADIRLPLYGVVIAVIAITFLLGKAGVAFGAGFATGFVAELLFMSGCTTQWADPGGTALADARINRRVEAASAEAEARAKRRWMSQVRERGLDLAAGVNRLELATGCVIGYWKKEGKYPAPLRDSLPDLGDGCWELRRTKDDETGWRILYSTIPGQPGEAPVGFRIKSGPDAALRMKGPLLEIDYQGLMVRRDSASAPAFAVGSPLFPITAVVMDCIRKNAPDAKPKSRNGTLTLRDLIFNSRGCTRIRLDEVKSDGGAVSDDPNVARLYLPTVREFAGFPLSDQSTSWELTYVPHGKTPADGYDMHARPMQYGFTGVRSYLLTGDGIHVTWEDRRATTSDPLAEPCERDPNQACEAGRR
jgi:hypothetical protein